MDNFKKENIMNKKTITITFITLVTVLVISFQLTRSSNAISDPGTISTAESRSAELEIKGLTCSGCAITAKIVLEKHEGVIKAEIDWESGKALVKFDGDRITPQQLADLLNEETPYVATISDHSPQSNLN